MKAPLPVTADGLGWLDDHGQPPTLDEHGRLVEPFILTYRDEHGDVFKRDRFMAGAILPATPAALTVRASVHVEDTMPESMTRPAPKPSAAPKRSKPKASIHAEAEATIAKKASNGQLRAPTKAGTPVGDLTKERIDRATRQAKATSKPATKVAIEQAGRQLEAKAKAAVPLGTDKPKRDVSGRGQGAAAKGDVVRIVHRKPEEKAGGPEVWRIWEKDTNRRVTPEAFTSCEAAEAFAKTKGWQVRVMGRKAEPVAVAAAS